MSARGASDDVTTWDEILHLVASMEELQRSKVFALARRLKPDLTLEDMRNPHDFPELADPDWHYEDGVMTGIQSVSVAVRAMRAARARRSSQGRGEP